MPAVIIQTLRSGSVDSPDGTRRAQAVFDSLVQRARGTNRERDSNDRAHGLAAPGDRSGHLLGDGGGGVLADYAAFVVLADTARMAIEAGLRMRDWDCVAEGYVMLLDDLLPRLKERFPVR